MTMKPEPEELQEASVGVAEEQDVGTPTSRASEGTRDLTEAKVGCSCSARHLQNVGVGLPGIWLQ